MQRIGAWTPITKKGRKGTGPSFRWLLVMVPAILAGCEDDGDPTTPSPGQEVTVELDFTDPTTGDADGWDADFAHFSPQQEEIMEFAWGHEPLPDDLEGEGYGLMVGATNRSDDVFMYWTGPVEGLEPNTEYDVRFTVEFATDSPAGCVGIGGPPGESVWVKTGATLVRPEPVLEDDYWLMSIDKGNQSMGGEDAIIVGDVANAESGCHADERVWELKTLESEDPFFFSTDDQGRGWLLVGTDSGFEGRTVLFYTRLTAEFSPA